MKGFKKQAAECIRITKEKVTHTLRYDWFLSSDGTECEVREAYTGPEGLIEHNNNILQARTMMKQARRVAWLIILVVDAAFLLWGAMAALVPEHLLGPGSRTARSIRRCCHRYVKS